MSPITPFGKPFQNKPPIQAGGANPFSGISLSSRPIGLNALTQDVDITNAFPKDIFLPNQSLDARLERFAQSITIDPNRNLAFLSESTEPLDSDFSVLKIGLKKEELVKIAPEIEADETASEKPARHTLLAHRLKIDTRKAIPMELQVLADSADHLSPKNLGEGIKTHRYAFNPKTKEAFPEEVFSQIGIHPVRAIGLKRMIFNVLNLLSPILSLFRNNPLKVETDGTVRIGSRYQSNFLQDYMNNDKQLMQLFDLARLPNGKLGVIQQETLETTLPEVSLTNPHSKAFFKEDIQQLLK